MISRIANLESELNKYKQELTDLKREYLERGADLQESFQERHKLKQELATLKELVRYFLVYYESSKHHDGYPENLLKAEDELKQAIGEEVE